MGLKIAREPGYQTKGAMVYQTLRRAIMQGQLPPGQRLIIDDIAQQLGVSHIPVREALQLLASEGLAESVPHSGATVAAISEEALVEVFALKEGLELVAVRIAAARLTPADARALAALLDEMDAALAAGRHERWAELNSPFHRRIARLTGMPLLEEMTDRALDRWERVRRHFFSSVVYRRVAQAQREHHALVAAMQACDEAAMEGLVKAHNRGALAAYQEHLARQGG